MGTIQHNAVLATTWSEEKFDKIKNWILSLPESEQRFFFIQEEKFVNGYKTIVVLPDGSEEGWEDSHDGDARRYRLIRKLHEKVYDDDSNDWDFISVGYGELGISVSTK